MKIEFLEDGEKNLYEIKHIKDNLFSISDFEFTFYMEGDVYYLKTSEDFLETICQNVNEKKVKDINLLLSTLTLEYEKEITSDLKEDSPLYKNQDVFETENDNHDLKFVDRIRWNNEDFNMDIFLYVFEFLPPTHVFQLNRVSKEWKKLAEDEKLWETICKREDTEKSEDSCRQSFICSPLSFEKGKGILRFLGTKEFKETECDPLSNGVKAINNYTATHDPSGFIKLKPCVTQISSPTFNVSYLGFDFSSTHYKLCPNHYWIQHRNDFDETALRNWNLEGSNDGEQWDILLQHVDDHSLVGKMSSEANWKIKSKTFYNRFRLLCTGYSSGSTPTTYSHFNLGQIEIYGKLKRMK